MNKDELVGVVDHVCAAWAYDPNPPQRKAMYRTWSEYIGDLPHDAVMAEVRRAAVANEWQPRPGVVRARVVDRINPSTLPSADDAWRQACERMDAVVNGVYPWPDVHPAVAGAMKAMGRSGQDRQARDAFDRAWQATVAADRAERAEVRP